MRTRASKASMDKRVKKCESTDWLISIPLELLHHILSFIDMKELIQMSVLSKNWRYMWKSLPTINISQEFWKGDEYEYPGSAFQYFVDKVLVGRDDSSDIYKFSLIVCEDFEEEEFPPIMFDGYINVVRISNVQEIHLGAIPEIFVSTLISLAEQVKVLKLVSISFHSDEEEFNVNSSTLESLSLEECCVDLEGIIIHAPKLRYLVIDNNDNDACKIEIHAPNLTLLHLRGYMYGEYSMGDLSLLVDAHIDTLNVCKEKRGLVRRLNTLLKGLVHAQTLTISAHAFQPVVEFEKA
ncbi:hypothetical protein IFM89_033787 [Coptis chinensis]|uniref:F-box domain-containing protein n=1 Tax=Coptis chinensis TaxID=261450 RepID=A0A835HRE7_9MAGN|nr:hypothetical protein IFM89_033787 [Coptis chinensis]